MAFEFDLDQPEPVFVGPSDYVVDFTLGYDIDRGERVLMSVVLFKDDGGGDPQYRVKSKSESHERVVSESDLVSSASPNFDD